MGRMEAFWPHALECNHERFLSSSSKPSPFIFTAFQVHTCGEGYCSYYYYHYYHYDYNYEGSIYTFIMLFFIGSGLSSYLPIYIYIYVYICAIRIYLYIRIIIIGWAMYLPGNESGLSGGEVCDGKHRASVPYQACS